MLDEIWGQVSREARRRFAEDSWQALISESKSQAIAAQALKSLCVRLQVRSQSLIGMPTSHAVLQFTRHFDRVLDLGKVATAFSYLAGRRKPQLDALHELLGCDPQSEDSAGPPSVTIPQCTLAFEELSHRFGSDDARLLFATVAMYGFLSWRQPIRGALLASHPDPGEGDASDVVALRLPANPLPQQGETSDSAEQLLPERPLLQNLDAISAQSIPTLLLPDNLVIDAVVRNFSAFDVEEAASRSRELVEQYRHLDPSRSESFFHVGFVDALEGCPRLIRGAEVNAPRKCWYLAGYFLGYCRRADVVASLAMLSEVRDEVNRLGDDVKECGALPYIIHPGISLFDAADRPTDVARLMEECHPLDLQGILLGLRSVGSYLASNNLAAARDVHASIPIARLASLARTERQDPLFLHRRYHATILRMSARLQEAEDVYRLVWEDAISLRQRSLALDGFALCAAGICDLSDIAITERNGDSLRRSADRVREIVSDNPAVLAGPRTAIICSFAAIVRGVQSPEAAVVAQQLRDARDRFERHGITDDAYACVLRRIDAYAAMLDLRSGIDARAEGAAQSIATMLASEAVDCLPPIQLCSEALQNAMICGAPASEGLADAIATRFGSASLEALPHVEIGRRSAAVAQRIAQYLNDSTSAISPGRRFDVASSLLVGMFEFVGVIDRATARLIVDAMSRAGAADSQTSKVFADFLVAHRSALLRILVEDEIDDHFAAACLRCGDFVDAASAIVHRMNSAFRDADFAQLRRLVSQADELGAGDQVPEPIRRRLAQLDSEATQEAHGSHASVNHDGSSEPPAEDFVVEYYSSSSGDRPVLDFADAKYSRDRDGGQRYLAALLALPARFATGQGGRVSKLVGHSVSVPRGGSIDLWEYRALQLSGGWVRILFACLGARLVLLHAFSKNQNQIADEDFETAEKRLREYIVSWRS